MHAVRAALRCIPCGQGEQLELPGLEEIDPGLHGVQLEAPALEKNPAKHKLHED